MISRLALLTALALGPATTAEPEAAREAPASVDESDLRARELFLAGQAKYETHDYAGAIADFTAAYAHAQNIAGDQRDEVLARLSFNLARAHVSAFDVDANPEHLDLARRLLADFRGHERARGRDPDADTDVRRLERDLSERERALDPLDPGGPSTEQDPGPLGPDRSRGQRSAGITLLVLGAPFAGLAVGGALIGSAARRDFETVTTGDAREAAQRRGRTGDVLLGVGVGLAAASVMSGAALLGVSMASDRARVQARLTGTGLLIEGVF